MKMEVLWILLLVVLCSCTDFKKENNSIVNDFYLLDSSMQLEICNMIKEPNTSSQFPLEEQLQVKRDFCTNLEFPNNQGVKKNTSSRSSDSVSFTSRRSPIIKKTLPTENPEIFKLETGSNKPTLVVKNEVPSSTTNTLERSPILYSNSQDYSLIKLPGISNNTQFIRNFNTPMSPYSTDIDQKSNPTVFTSWVDPNGYLYDIDEVTTQKTSAFGSNNYRVMTNASTNRGCFCGCSGDDHTTRSVKSVNKKCKICSTSGSSVLDKSGNNAFSKSTKHSTATSSEYVLEISTEKANEGRTKSTKIKYQPFPATATSIYVSTRNSGCIKCSTRKSETTNSIFCSRNSTVKLQKINISETDSLELNSTPESNKKSNITSYTQSSKNRNTSTGLSAATKCFPSDSLTPVNESSEYSGTSTSPIYFTIKSSTRFDNHSFDLTSNPIQSTANATTQNDITLRLLNSSVNFRTKLNPSDSQYDGHITTTYHPSKSSTPYFCGSSSTKQYKTTATYTNSTKRPICSPLKLTINPKSPRASRKHTKILSSLGNLHSYAGFFKTNQTDNTRLFFWFFCNNKWKNTPLIVWLQGEPGQSSLNGLFQEHGPYYLDHSSNSSTIELRQFSWTKEYSVLYLDHCVGCGFSSSEDKGAYSPTYEKVTTNVYEALSQFFKVWYEMRSNDLYLAGSYGGAKYIPVIAQTIHTRNQFSTCVQRMNLKGLVIGGPYMDSETMINYNDFFFANGIIDEVTYKDMIPMQSHAQELIRAGKYQDVIEFLNLHVYCLISQAGYKVYNDVRFLNQSPHENIQNIVQSELFKRMICIDNVNFETKSNVLIEEIMPSVDNLIPELLSHYKVLYYNGQFDIMAPYMLTSKALSKLRWQSIDQFYTTEMIQWCPTKDAILCPYGYYRSYQNLTHVMIRNAGHYVGMTNQESLFYLLKWFVEDEFQRYRDFGN